MPRRKSEKSQLPQIHPPPAKSICFRRGPPITRQEEISSDSEDLTLETAVESNSSPRVSFLTNSSLPVQQPNSCFPNKAVSEDSDAKPNRSLEALFQAADSELQNYETSVTRTSLSPRLVLDGAGSSSGVFVQLPDSVRLIANPQGMPKFTTSQDSVDIKSIPVPLFRLNFATDLKPNTLELQTRTDLGSTQEVIRVENPSSLSSQVNAGLEPGVSAELQGVNFSPGQQKPKHALKLGKCGGMYKPGKYVCMYCNRSCAKPSVLQKHLRTHTGERPYPCNDCGFRFKTKSNLYKHCKSRVHLTKMEPGQDAVAHPTSEDYSGNTASLEIETPQDLFGKGGVESGPTNDEKLPHQTMHKPPNLGVKFLSCDAQLGRAASTEFDPQQTLAARSFSVPESNEDRLSVALHSLLRLSDGSIYLMEKLCNGHAILRPVLQEIGLGAPIQTVGVTAPSSQSVGMVIPNQSVAMATSNLPDVVTGPQATNSNAWVVSNTATIPFASVAGTKQTGNEQIIIQVPESLQIQQKEIHSPLSLPEKAPPLHSSYSKILRKSSSANVATSTTSALTAHQQRSHSFSSNHAISIAPKMAPIDPKNATREAVQERIAMLISQNASIIDMPMADAPRQKRVLRHNSEVAASATNTESTTAGNLMKPLQRAKSLVPYTSMSPLVTLGNAEMSTASSSSVAVVTKKKKAESVSSVDSSSRTTSNFLLVPSDPHLKACGGPPMRPAGIRSQTSNLELVNPTMFPRPALPIKAKSLDITTTGKTETTFVRSMFPQKAFSASAAVGVPVGMRLDETAAAAQKGRIFNELVDGSGATHVPTGGPQDIHVVFHLPSSNTPEVVNPPKEPDALATNTSAREMRTMTKAVSEKRQEFARTHLTNETVSRTQSAIQMTNSAEATMENSSKIGPSVPLQQFLVIPAATNPTQTFVPVVQSTLPMLVPHTAKSFDSATQNSSISTDIGESGFSLKRGRPKGVKNKHKPSSSSVSTPPNTTTTTTKPNTFHSIPSICVTPAESVPTTESSLWKLKLKGRLLMKRSLSIERTLSEERENALPNNRSLDAGTGSSVAADTHLPPSDSLVHQETSQLQRSCSYDAAMPLKKRRKTLTELGRGTAFGTRVEDGAEAAAAAAAAAAQSRASPLLAEIGKRSPSPAGNRRLCPTVGGSDVQVVKAVGSCAQQESEILPECAPLSQLSVLADTPTNQSSQRHCASSAICSVRGCQKFPDVLRIPVTVAQKVPGLLPPDRTDVHLLHPLDNFTVNQHLEVLDKLDNHKNTDADINKSAAAGRRLNPTSNATLKFACRGHLENAFSGGSANGVHSELRNAECGIESVVVQTGVASTLLLLSHLYPSLNPSANTTFCSVMKPQPMYLSQDANKKLSMYSTWQVASPAVSSCSPAPPEVSVSSTLVQRHMSITVSPHLYATSNMSGAGVLTHSSYWNFKKVLEKKSKSQEGATQVDDVAYELPAEVEVQRSSAEEEVAEISVQEIVALPDKSLEPESPDATAKTNPTSKASTAVDMPKKATTVTKETKRVQIFPGGYKSNEDYVYIRGRGKGKYVCEACGIRCKKPSMLKKHLRTHTDIRPHHCDVCSFGFKTKGNLSKHIKSKAHHSRCSELGIAPVQRFSDDASFDSQMPISSGAENNESLDMNVASSSGDVNDDDEDLDDVDNDDSKEDNDEDEDDEEDDDDDDDGDSLDGDGDDSLMSLDVPESSVALGKNAVLESNRSGNSFEGCSFSVQDDMVRAVTDSEAAASLLDLSKGDPTLTTISNMPSIINENPFVSHPQPMSHSLAVFSRSFLQPSSGTNSQIQDQETKSSSQEQRNDNGKELQHEVIPRKSAGFIPPVLLITSRPSPSSFQSPVFVAIASTSMTPSIPNLGGDHPWVMLPSSVLLQKDSEAGQQPSPPVHDTHCHDGQQVTVALPNILTPSVLPPVCSPVSPSGDSPPAAGGGGGNKTRAACEIVPVPGRVSGNVAAECVDGKYVKYVCPVCTKSFSKAHQLVLHKNIHYMERPFRCFECGVSFQNRTLLDRHQRSEKHAAKTDDPRPFKCDNCGVAFRIHGHLAKHLRSKVHIAKCDGPGKGSTEERDSESEDTVDVAPEMESVVAFETGSSDPAAVEVELAVDAARESQSGGASNRGEMTVLTTALNVRSSSTVALNVDANVLAALRKNKSFSDADRSNNEGSSSLQPESHRCDICSKVFQDVALFEKHISSHVELRPYICEFCDAGFTNARLLESHLNTHYQTKEHVCGVCGDMLTGKMPLHPQSDELHASPSSRHCSRQQQQPASEPSNVMLSAPTETLNRVVSTTNDLRTCAVRILPEISAGNQLLRVNEAISCTGTTMQPSIESSSAGGSLLKVIPSQNILALTNPNVLLMKSFNVGTLPDNSANNIALSLGSVNFPSGSLVRSTETLKSGAVTSQPLGILLAAPRSTSFENRAVLNTGGGFVPFHDSRQVSIRPDGAAVAAGEPVCRFLTVSFQIGENVFSDSSVRTDHEKSAFIAASNFAEIVQNSAASSVSTTTSASNLL